MAAQSLATNLAVLATAVKLLSPDALAQSGVPTSLDGVNLTASAPTNRAGGYQASSWGLQTNQVLSGAAALDGVQRVLLVTAHGVAPVMAYTNTVPQAPEAATAVTNQVQGMSVSNLLAGLNATIRHEHKQVSSLRLHVGDEIALTNLLTKAGFEPQDVKRITTHAIAGKFEAMSASDRSDLSAKLRSLQHELRQVSSGKTRAASAAQAAGLDYAIGQAEFAEAATGTLHIGVESAIEKLKAGSAALGLEHSSAGDISTVAVAARERINSAIRDTLSKVPPFGEGNLTAEKAILSLPQDAQPAARATLTASRVAYESRIKEADRAIGPDVTKDARAVVEEGKAPNTATAAGRLVASTVEYLRGNVPLEVPQSLAKAFAGVVESLRASPYATDASKILGAAISLPPGLLTSPTVQTLEAAKAGLSALPAGQKQLAVFASYALATGDLAPLRDFVARIADSARILGPEATQIALGLVNPKFPGLVVGVQMDAANAFKALTPTRKQELVEAALIVLNEPDKSLALKVAEATVAKHKLADAPPAAQQAVSKPAAPAVDPAKLLLEGVAKATTTKEVEDAVRASKHPQAERILDAANQYNSERFQGLGGKVDLVAKAAGYEKPLEIIKGLGGLFGGSKKEQVPAAQPKPAGFDESAFFSRLIGANSALAGTEPLIKAVGDRLVEVNPVAQKVKGQAPQSTGNTLLDNLLLKSK